MFVPIPILIVIGLAFLLMLFQMLRASRGPDPLLGAPPKFPQAPVTRRPEMPMTPPATLSPEAEAQIRALLAAGRKIEAIKIARDTMHLGLKDAKDFVEGLE